MTHVSDGYRTGQTFSSIYGEGAFTSPRNVYDIVPLTAELNNIAPTQTPLAAGFMTLAAGTGITTGTIQNTKGTLILDVPRVISVTGISSTTAANFTVYGYDAYKTPMAEEIVGPVGAVTVEGNKAFAYVTKIFASGATVGTITVGTSDIFGLPFVATSRNYAITAWAGAQVTTGTFAAADQTSPATLSTGDVRGTYATPTASNGTNRLTIDIYMKGALPSNTDITQLYGVTQATA